MSNKKHSPQPKRSEALSGRLSKSASELSCAPATDAAPPRARSAHQHTPLSVVHRTQHFFTSLKSRWHRSKSRERCPGGAALSVAPALDSSTGTDGASSDSTPANSPRHRGRVGRRDQALNRRLSTEPVPSTSGTPAHQARPPPELLQLEPDEGQKLREQHLRQYAFFQLRIHLKRGQNLVAMDKNGLLSGTSDPYVKFKVGGRLLHKSRIVYRDLNPVWDECFTVPIEDPFQPVHLKVFDYDWGLQDDFMGSCQLDLTALELGRTQDLVLCLRDPNKPHLDMGEVVLNVTLWPKSQEDKDQAEFHLAVPLRKKSLEPDERDCQDISKYNEVDIEALQLLDQAQIKTLIPAIGPQAKFKKALDDWNIQKRNQINTADLENIVSVYGEGVEGLTPSLTTPIGSPSISSRSDSSTTISNQYLTTLLNASPDGKVLLAHIEGKEPLGEQLRKILIRIVSTYIVKETPEAPVTATIYQHWLQEIKKLFPSENISVYYTKSEGPHRAHGRLFDAVTNLKAKYRRHNVYQPRSRRSLDKTLTPKSSTSDHLEDLLSDQESDDQDIEECLEWLRSSVDDYNQCTEKWRKTNKERLKRVLSTEKQSYIQEFPCLKRSWGHLLLTADFDLWYPGNDSALEDKLPLLKIKLLAASDKISRKSQFVTELKKLARQSDNETSNVAALLLIPHLLGPVHFNKKKRSAAEVRQSFILHVEQESQLQEERLKRQDAYAALGITIQPYIVIAGPLTKVSARYVAVNDITYELPNIGSAVDTCFKIIWAVNLEYPSECKSVWHFLQRALYKFPAKAVLNEKLSSSVLSLLNDCGITN